ncbi:cobalt import ATP-binding protein CbiO 2 [Treponema primitia ZAS-2]|uniref:Cobalt import ATP-binding protein CbiO 2 n=2 Tax=Treponema primitia (strain ATCC BAA-887 / DSM 12427 / ZAS-2) TaxID=545694 RepID=F5YLU9_TREPZ|nr:ATP-binding cassette domain-containing protein [Treponema primitia]AEF84967.1 cobalt import ATP-binding protein CbiO 2 [Treponema primitia ZAS-2]
MSAPSLIEIKGLEYAYHSGARVLHDINLSVCKGEFVAIVGQNGSGKSTLARLMAGIDFPSAGQVLAGGINTRDKKLALDLRKTIGIVFQNPENQIVFEKVADDMAFALGNLGLDKDEIAVRIRETAAMMGIENFTDGFELSMGQKQRVAIAGVLAMRPECIIFDEPTAMLDPRGKKDIHSIIVDQHKRGLTVVYVTNVIDEVLSADRIIILSGGSVKYEFEKKDLFRNIDKLKELGLETPFIFESVDKLKSRGIDIELEDYTLDDLTEKIAEKVK